MIKEETTHYGIISRLRTWSFDYSPWSHVGVSTCVYMKLTMFNHIPLRDKHKHTHTHLLKLTGLSNWVVECTRRAEKKNKHSNWEERRAVELGKLAADATHALIWSWVLSSVLTDQTSGCSKQETYRKHRSMSRTGAIDRSNKQGKSSDCSCWNKIENCKCSRATVPVEIK